MVMAVVMGGAITAGAAITTAGRAVVIAAGINTETKHKVAASVGGLFQLKMRC
jgi:hypothetical protein